MDHQELKDLLPLAALDRLEPDEARALEEHLRGGCAGCEAELRAYREAVAALATTMEGAGSEQRIWENLEARLHHNAAASHALAHSVSRPAHADHGERRSGAGWWRGFAAIAAAAALALFFYDRSIVDSARRAEIQQLGQYEKLSWELRNLHSDLDAARMEAYVLRNVLVDRAKLERVLLAPDLQLTRLAPLPPARGGVGLVAVSNASRNAVFQAFGLPETPPGKTYELWWITKESGPVRAGTFIAQTNRSVVTAASMPPAGERVMLAAVTLEPSGGVDKPTGAMYLKGSPERE
jgi:anti-sigma-K factor RskA